MPRFTMKAALAVTFLFSAMTTAANSAEIVPFRKRTGPGKVSSAPMTAANCNAVYRPTNRFVQLAMV